MRPRAGAALDTSAAPGIRDDVVTPRAASGRLGWTHEAIEGRYPARIRTLPRRRSRAWGQFRRRACLVRGGRQGDLTRSGERKNAALDRGARPCRDGFRREASL